MFSLKNISEAEARSWRANARTIYELKDIKNLISELKKYRAITEGMIVKTKLTEFLIVYKEYDLQIRFLEEFCEAYRKVEIEKAEVQ